PDKVMDLGLTHAPDIVDAVTEVLGVTDQLTSTERDAFITYLGGPSADLNLFDYNTRNTKLNGLFALVMQSPPPAASSAPVSSGVPSCVGRSRRRSAGATSWSCT